MNASGGGGRQKSEKRKAALPPNISALIHLSLYWRLLSTQYIGWHFNGKCWYCTFCHGAFWLYRFIPQVAPVALTLNVRTMPFLKRYKTHIYRMDKRHSYECIHFDWKSSFTPINYLRNSLSYRSHDILNLKNALISIRFQEPSSKNKTTLKIWFPFHHIHPFWPEGQLVGWE